jgi:hypothetical protein
MTEVTKAEITSKAAAIKSLSSGIRDTVSMAGKMPREKVVALDHAFIDIELPPYSTIRSLASRDLLHIIEKSCLSSDDEYFMLTALQDVDLPTETQRRVTELLGKYELNKI